MHQHSVVLVVAVRATRVAPELQRAAEYVRVYCGGQVSCIRVLAGYVANEARLIRYVRTVVPPGGAPSRSWKSRGPRYWDGAKRLMMKSRGNRSTSSSAAMSTF